MERPATLSKSAVPNANNPRLVTRLLEMVAQGVRSSRGLQEALGVEPRTVQYYVQAAEWLGLLESEGDAYLTPLGLEYVYGGRARPRIYARAVWQTRFVTELMQGRAATPTTDEIAERVARLEPELSAATVQRRASAVRSLIAPALSRSVEPPSEERQLALPLASRPTDVKPPRLRMQGGREYNPDVYRYLLSALLDHGELSLGQVRALLDSAQVNDAPIGGYVDLAIGRGEAVRVEERLVVSRQAIDRRELVETTASIVLSDPGYRAYLADLRAAARGDRQAEIRRERLKARYRTWERRLFGHEVEPDHVEEELRRVLMDRGLESFPAATGPGLAPPVLREPFLDVWERDEIAITLPPTLALLRSGVGHVNQALKAARHGAQDVAPPDVSTRPVVFHGGLVHPGEPLPRSVPDARSLRLRLLVHSPYAALTAALLLVHRRAPGRVVLQLRRGAVHVRIDGKPAGDLLSVLDDFARDRGWLVARRRQGGMPSGTWLSVLEATGIASIVGQESGGTAVLAERFFLQLRTDAEEIEVHHHLEPLAEAFESWLDKAVSEEQTGA